MVKYLYLLSIVLVNLSLKAQVTVSPSFPTIEDDVIITFDATQGNGELAGVPLIYAHTGLITENSSTPTDWKYVQGKWGTADETVKMTNIGNNKHQISYNIKDFYGVPMSEIVKQMAFVFRNANGTLIGRATDGSDIYTPVFSNDSELKMNVYAPIDNNTIITLDDTVHIDLELSKEATITIYDNNTILHQTIANNFEYDHVITTIGKHDIKIVAKDSLTTLTRTFRHIINPEVNELEIDIPLGINYTSDTSITLALYAPNKSFVYVLGSFNEFLLDENYFMHFSSSNDIWWIEINGLEAGVSYTFQYYVDGMIKIGDPYSELVLDPWNDKYIEEDVYPNLMPYPAEQTNGILSVVQTAKTPFDWQHDNYTRPNKSSLIIYEVLMRDFLESHSYSDLQDTLDYLQKLGVNAIELMPVNEFEGNRGWGYNPSYHLALDKYYGTPEAFKSFIDAAHSRGMAVILDVVYNHAFSQSPLAQLYWDNGQFKPTPDNPWLNVDAKHPYNVGYDFNHESDATKYYVDRSLQLWLENYHIDGYRFDLSKGFTQNESTNNAQMAAYDQSRIDILTHYAETVWDIDENAYVILEHFATNSEEKVLVAKGMMVWGNNSHEYAEASMGYSSNLAGASYKSRGFANPGLVSYMESHDEERNMYKNKTWGSSLGAYNVKNLETGLERAGLSAAFHLMIPGPKMIWQFGELGYDYSINTCENGTVNNDCRLSPKPIRWDYLDQPNRKKIFDIYAFMNHLRQDNEIFETTDFDFSLATFQKRIRLKGAEQDMIMIGNFAMETKDNSPGFTKTGMWYELYTQDSLIVDDVDMSISLSPGAFRLYATKKWEINTSVFNIGTNLFTIYPNPANDRFYINASQPSKDFSWIVYDLLGRVKVSGNCNNYCEISLDQMNSGIYLIHILDKSGTITTQKLIKQ